jgi:hypothetical protein
MCNVNFHNEKLPQIESVKVLSRGKIALDLPHCLKKIHCYKITAVTVLTGNSFKVQVKHN